MLARRDRIALSLAPLPWFDLVLATPGFVLADLDPPTAIRTADRAILAHAAAGHLKAIDARL